MQTTGTGDDMRLSFYCKDPDSKGNTDCATLYATDQATWIVQGRRRGEQVAEQLVALADDETFVEIPEGLVEVFVAKYVKERHGIDLAGTSQRAGGRRP